MGSGRGGRPASECGQPAQRRVAGKRRITSIIIAARVLEHIRPRWRQTLAHASRPRVLTKAGLALLFRRGRGNPSRPTSRPHRPAAPILYPLQTLESTRLHVSQYKLALTPRAA